MALDIGASSVVRHRVGVVGAGAIALASAAWMRYAGHEVALWSPRSKPAPASARATWPLRVEGLRPGQVMVQAATDAHTLCRASDVLLIALPVDGHRRAIDQLLPALRDGQWVIVSSMSSLSALYLREQAMVAGKDVTVLSFSTTVLTARRVEPDRVRIMMRRSTIGVSSLPQSRIDEGIALCERLFGGGFVAQSGALASAIANVNPTSHGPMALLNWTRIERGEAWPQYHYLTPSVARVIEALDAERRALAKAFGIAVGTVEQYFKNSFGVEAEQLKDIADELHAKRGGPPGPTDLGTRYLTEDIPFGLVFLLALGEVAKVPMPATRTVVDAVSLASGHDYAGDNDLIGPLGLRTESVAGLIDRLR